MKIYTIKFSGRLASAIGVCYTITETVKAENYDAAIAKLYDKYEHISVINWSEK